MANSRGIVTNKRWQEFQKEKAQNRKDADEKSKEPLKVSEKMTKPIAIVPERTTSVGKRRRVTHNQWDRDPIDGYSLRYSDIARHVMGLKYGGEAMREAFASAAIKFDLKPLSVERIFYRNRELFELAEQELMEMVSREYCQNLSMIRTSMSGVGLKAVDTIDEILDDPDASASVKSKCAIAVLKMLDVDGSASTNPNARVALESLKVVRDVKIASMKGAESHIKDVEAEDAVVVEEIVDESRISNPM